MKQLMKDLKFEIESGKKKKLMDSPDKSSNLIQ